MDQGYDMDQADDLDQLQNRRKKDTFVDDVADGHATATWDKRRHEGLKRLSFEKKLQERAKDRAAALKKEATAAKARKNAKRLAECKKEYAVVAKRFNESVARSNKMKQVVATATKKLQEARSNSVAARSAGNKTVDSLRNKLAESNLLNAKLLYTNKLLQNEQLSARQKTAVIRQLQSAKTVNEAKLVFDSLSATLAGSQKTVTEGADRKVLGSGSRATRPAATQTLNEGYEAERWAKLAGIVK
jgi:YesN/AraC family two-component response regulator